MDWDKNSPVIHPSATDLRTAVKSLPLIHEFELQTEDGHPTGHLRKGLLPDKWVRAMYERCRVAMLSTGANCDWKSLKPQRHELNVQVLRLSIAQ